MHNRTHMKLLDILEANGTDTGMTVKQVSESAGMSRKVVLHRLEEMRRWGTIGRNCGRYFVRSQG